MRVIFKKRDNLLKLLRLSSQLLRRRRKFFGNRRMLLRGAIQLLRRKIDLRHAGMLLAARRIDFLH